MKAALIKTPRRTLNKIEDHSKLFRNFRNKNNYTKKRSKVTGILDPKAFRFESSLNEKTLKHPWPKGL